MSHTPAQYFNSYVPEPLTRADKAAMYKSFLEKKQYNQHNNRARIYKGIAYSVSTMAVISSILFGNFFGFFDHQPTEINQFVVAHAIGKIISSEGKFTIYNSDHRAIAGDTIELTDRIVLETDAQVNILVHDSFIAQVAWPAQFEIVLSEDQQSYNLNFSNGGDNIDINSVSESNKNISIQTSDGVVIKNNDNDKSQNLSFSVKKNKSNGKRSVINKSNGSIEISNSNNENKQEKVIIQAKHSANFEKDVEKKNIQISDQEEIIEDVSPTTGDSVLTGNKIKIKQEVEKEHIVTGNDIKNIKQALNKSFLMSEYNDLVVNYLVGKDNEYQVSIMNINRRLDRLAPIANLSLQQVDSLTWLIQYAHSIIRWFEQYNINPELYQNLPLMIQNIDRLPDHEYGFLYETNKKKTVDINFIESIVTLQIKTYL